METNSSFPCFGKHHNLTSQQWWQKVSVCVPVFFSCSLSTYSKRGGSAGELGGRIIYRSNSGPFDCKPHPFNHSLSKTAMPLIMRLSDPELLTNGYAEDSCTGSVCIRRMELHMYSCAKCTMHMQITCNKREP